MSAPEYSPDAVPVTGPALPGEPCRWYAFLGGEGCDACGRMPWAHDGELRLRPDAGPFTRDGWEGRYWSDDLRANWEAAGHTVPPRPLRPGMDFPAMTPTPAS